MNTKQKDLYNLEKEKHLELDKFYTKKSIARKCFLELNNTLHTLNRNEDVCFIEPSAGSGVFLEVAGRSRSIGFDIEPTAEDIYKNDFLNGDISSFITDNTVFFGNPPFGKRSKLALDFINKAFEYSDIVAFILPVQFRKWQTQKNVNLNAKLVLDLDLPENAFEFYGEDYSVRCCFQVWVLDNKTLPDLRLKEAPPTTHNDFEMYQYNNTYGALKFFDYDWNFAVLRQGWGDYSELYFDKDDLSRSKQWIFFKAKNKTVLKRLMKLDFEALAKLNTSVKGFGKADVVKAYTKLYGQGECDE